MKTDDLTKHLTQLSIAIAFMLGTSVALSQTTLQIDHNGNSKTVEVSKDNPLVIEFAMGKVHRIDGRVGVDWTMDSDEASLKAMQEIGKAIITPISDKPFSLLVTRDDKRTIRLNLEPKKTGEQQLVLSLNSDMMPLMQTIDPEVEKTFAKADSRDKLILAFLKVMAGNDGKAGFNKTNTNQKLSLWQETDITKIQTWHGRSLQGEVWLLKNQSEQSLTLDERDFYTDGISAIAISNPVIAPGQETRVFLVREPK